LIVDDDRNIRELVRIFLKPEGFLTVDAADGFEALHVLASTQVDMVVLDILMPNMDGWELCKVIRGLYDIPILMVTAKSEIRDKAKGFGLGTDDYLTKPFDPQELVLRVKALMRRYEIDTSGTVEVGNVRLDRNALLVEVGGRLQTFRKKEFDLLFALAAAPGRVLSREFLIDDVGGFVFDGNVRTLDVLIGGLRDKLDTEVAGVGIRTVRGLGYRLEVML
jgi:DNA-binding response OmpR family regulator